MSDTNYKSLSPIYRLILVHNREDQRSDIMEEEHIYAETADVGASDQHPYQQLNERERLDPAYANSASASDGARSEYANTAAGRRLQHTSGVYVNTAESM